MSLYRIVISDVDGTRYYTKIGYQNRFVDKPEKAKIFDKLSRVGNLAKTLRQPKQGQLLIEEVVLNVVNVHAVPNS
jgi:hypothetical protein